MSIDGAISELNKELARLSKEVERVTKIRDSLVKESPSVAIPTRTKHAAPQKRKYTARKSAKTAAPAKKATATKKSVPAKTAPVKAVPPAMQRTVSAETRKKMSDAAKTRAAKKAEAVK